jgi:hypothetical protein
MQNATQNPHFDGESKHTAALALWRYSHDFVKAAQTPCEHDRIACNESQALYHPAAQGIESESTSRTMGTRPRRRSTVCSTAECAPTCR